MFTAGKYGPLHVGSTRYGFVLNVKATLRSVSQEEMMVVTVSDSGISSRHCLGNYKSCMYVYHVRVVNTNSLCLLHAYKFNQSRSMVSPHNGSVSLGFSLEATSLKLSASTSDARSAYEEVTPSKKLRELILTKKR